MCMTSPAHNFLLRCSTSPLQQQHTSCVCVTCVCVWTPAAIELNRYYTTLPWIPIIFYLVKVPNKKRNLSNSMGIFWHLWVPKHHILRYHLGEAVKHCKCKWVPWNEQMPVRAWPHHALWLCIFTGSRVPSCNHESLAAQWPRCLHAGSSIWNYRFAFKWLKALGLERMHFVIVSSLSDNTILFFQNNNIAHYFQTSLKQIGMTSCLFLAHQPTK